MSKSLSIITINYNNAEGLLKTIDSVLIQGFKDFEYIIIDGGSNDDSTAIIKQHENKIDYWISETDKGVYNAMNKGLKVAKGDYVLFLNSGDFLHNEKVLNQVFSVITPIDDLVYGDVVLRNEKINSERIQAHPEILPFSYFYNKTICQQACFIKRRLFEDTFYFNENYKISADWEFFIYAIYIKKVNYRKIDMLISVYNMEGISSIEKFREIAKKEREQTMETYFPLFKNDYKELSEYSSYRFKQLKEIESSPFLRKLASIFLKCCLFVLPRKKTK